MCLNICVHVTVGWVAVFQWHKLHIGVYRENVWHLGSKECFSKIFVWCHGLHHFWLPSMPLVHVYLIQPVATVTEIGMTWMCQQSTTSCWILTSHQTLSQMWMWKQSLGQAAVEMLTVWAPLHADTTSSRRAEWADAELRLQLQLPFPLTGAGSVEIYWKCCGAVRTQHLSGCLLPDIFVIKDCFAALNHTQGLFS